MEATASGPAKRVEVSPIQGQHIEDAVSIGEDNNGGISKPDIRVAVLRDDVPGSGDIGGGERLEAVSPAGNLIEEAEFGVDSDPCRQEIVEFGHYER